MSGEIPTPPPYPPRADDAACATRSRAEEAALRVRTAFYGSTASGEGVELVEPSLLLHGRGSSVRAAHRAVFA